MQVPLHRQRKCRPPAWRQRRRTGTSGFTLVELVLVAAIIAVAGSIALPRYIAGMNRYRVRAAAHRLAADLAMARAEAIKTSSGRIITFNQAALSYSISGTSSLTASGQPYVVNLSESPYRLSLWAAFTSSPGAVSFNGYGQPNGWCNIILVSSNAWSFVSIDPASGKVTIQ